MPANIYIVRMHARPWSFSICLWLCFGWRPKAYPPTNCPVTDSLSNKQTCKSQKDHQGAPGQIWGSWEATIKYILYIYIYIYSFSYIVMYININVYLYSSQARIVLDRLAARNISFRTARRDAVQPPALPADCWQTGVLWLLTSHAARGHKFGRNQHPAQSEFSPCLRGEWLQL